MTVKFEAKKGGPPTVKAMNSNELSKQYVDSLAIEYEFIGDCEADTTFTLGKETFHSPIMAGPMPIFNPEKELDYDYAMAVNAAESLFWMHFHKPDVYKKLLEAGAKVIREVRPFRSLDQILEAVKYDTEHGAVGYALDIAHGRDIYGELDAMGDEYYYQPQTIDRLKAVNDASPLPFFLKDIMSVKDALVAKEIGVEGIVLSGHNNRFPCAVPPLKILPKIREAVGNDMKIFVDGGINNGYDAFKALALGADGVLCARGLAAEMAKEGPEAVTYKMLQMAAELKGAMSATSSPDLAHINRNCIVKM